MLHPIKTTNNNKAEPPRRPSLQRWAAHAHGARPRRLAARAPNGVGVEEHRVAEPCTGGAAALATVLAGLDEGILSLRPTLDCHA
jgi:hypothetical protein